MPSRMFCPLPPSIQYIWLWVRPPARLKLGLSPSSYGRNTVAPVISMRFMARRSPSGKSSTYCDSMSWLASEVRVSSSEVLAETVTLSVTAPSSSVMFSPRLRPVVNTSPLSTRRRKPLSSARTSYVPIGREDME